MDDKSIEKIMEQREKRYIWLERKLRINLAVTTSVVAAFFLIIFLIQNRAFSGDMWMVCSTAIFLNALWCYLEYRREYRSYQEIAEYLDAFENGNYEFCSENAYMRPGIHSQLLEQLERLGRAFYVMKEQMVKEKEGTKALITDISHQIKTPVAALGMSLELMEDTKTTGAEKQEFLERGKGEVKKLNYLMGTLTNLSHMEQAMLRLQPKSASLKETLLRAVNGVYLKANEKQIEIEMTEFKDIELFHDVKWTAEAFTNVLDNAVKYSPAGSRVEIRVNLSYSYVSVEVEDEGIGVDKSEYTDIFKRFYRGKRSEVETQEGAGVGLYLVRKILEGQGGSVRVQASANGGSAFWMMLPFTMVEG